MHPHNFFSTDAPPSHSSRKNLILDSKKSPASTQEVSESEVPVHAESEVPVHVHPFAARVPSDSKGSECQCGIHTAEAASALQSGRAACRERVKISAVAESLKKTTQRTAAQLAR